MESQVVRRRMDRIACHLSSNEEVTANHIFPMNCSSNLNSAAQRCDNRILFARQGSIHQGRFMRQFYIKQDNPFQQVPSLNCSVNENEKSSFINSGQPKFARQAQTPPAFSRPNTRLARETQMVCNQPPLTSETPKFARQNTGLARENQFIRNQPVLTSNSSGMEWSPRMDIAESGRNYVVTVELPGVSIKGIRVEVDDKNLTVTGKRSTQWWRDSTPQYHKREISQGPYQVVWGLPSDVNKDAICAEFVGGFLQIIIPKL